ncbi:6-hydroxymethylpterin diphosphokinase MptE-like protein [Psychrobacillus sp. FSL K6-4615]|uniref:motility associated factor glycosyltransferase family protein n=1 Tax=Psychrobacillus sp. FSL K6-4615 TaxID=2921551 RepID=UPI0030F52CF0
MTYTISTVQSDSNMAVYVYEKSGKTTPLNSLYSPEKEAQRFLKKMSSLKNNFIVILGYGNGELFEQLVKSDVYKQNAHFLFIEPFQEVLVRDVHREIINSQRDKLTFIHYKNLTSISFMSFLNEYIGMPTSIQVHPNYIKIEEPIIKDCLQVINEGIKTKQISDNTEMWFAKDWIIEPLLNIQNTKKAIKIHTLKDKFKGERAILVAAGPSLQQHIEFLKDNKDFFHIFVVGPALRVLLDNGIEPDYVLSIDAGQLNYDTHFKGIVFEGTLIYETVSNSSIQTNHQGRLVVSKTANDYISPQFVDNLSEVLKRSPSVAVFTMRAIIYFGFSEVYLVGQDLALIDGEYYAKGVKHHAAVQNEKEELVVTNNLGQPVGTTRPLKIFLETFEAIIKTLPADIAIFNLSKHGAKIEGTIFIEESVITKEMKNIIILDEEPQEILIDPLAVLKEFTGKLKGLQKQVFEAKDNLDRLIQIGLVTANDMPKVVKDFSGIRNHPILVEVLLANVTFMFKKINNEFQLFDLKKRYMSQDYLELITELETFYALIGKLCTEIIKDERIKNYK